MRKKLPLYLKTDVSYVGLRAGFLQFMDGKQIPQDEAPDNIALQPITFASKNLISAETRFSNIEREALGILHSLERFHHQCITHEVSMVTDHEL